MLGDPASSNDGLLVTRSPSHQLSRLLSHALTPHCNIRTIAAWISVTGCQSSEEGMVVYFV